jgi:hypothetical protein
LATSANNTRSADGSSRRPLSSRFIVLPISSRCQSASSTQVPPSGRDSVNANPSAVAASAASGSRNRVRTGLDRHLVLVVAEVVGDLALKRRLQHPLGQLLQQTTLADQIQTLLPGLGHQLPDQIPGRVAVLEGLADVGRHSIRLHFSCRHQASLLDQELHRKTVQSRATRTRFPARTAACYRSVSDR